MGFGQSVAFTPMTMLAFATLPRHQITEGSAVFTMMRNFGSSLFISHGRAGAGALDQPSTTRA